MNSELLDEGINFQTSPAKLTASQEEIRKAIFWAWMGGIGGIILGGKLSYSSSFSNGEVHYHYDESSREAGRKAQRIGLFIWIPMYILFIVAYIILLFSIDNFL